MLPPVDDLRQAAFFLPYALLRTNADSALAAKARRMQQAAGLWRILCTCTLGLLTRSQVYHLPVRDKVDSASQEGPVCML